MEEFFTKSILKITFETVDKSFFEILKLKKKKKEKCGADMVACKPTQP